MKPPRTTVAGLRRQDWAFFVMLFCAGGIIASTLAGDGPLVVLAYALGTIASALMARHWSRVYPAPMPHALRWILYLSHPGLSPRRLHRVLNLREGQRVLEIGPGIGHHALPTAAVLGPLGQLDVVDIQPRMLEDLCRRAAERGIDNIVPQKGNAERLPYPNDTFDAAYLITVLGEVPRPDWALRELARVLKPGGRIAIGEIFLDPDYVAPRQMRELAAESGLIFARQLGTRLSYFARLDVPGGSGLEPVPGAN